VGLHDPELEKVSEEFKSNLQILIDLFPEFWGLTPALTEDYSAAGGDFVA
jgi:hypothetical protein